MGTPSPSPAQCGLGSPVFNPEQRLDPWASGALLAGFAAGQTHTRCRRADRQSGATLAEGEGPGVSHLAAVAGRARFAAALRQSLAAARQALPADRRQDTLAAAAVGASGIEAGSAVQQEGLDLAAEALALPAQRLVVTGDEHTADGGVDHGEQDSGFEVFLADDGRKRKIRQLTRLLICVRRGKSRAA